MAQVLLDIFPATAIITAHELPAPIQDLRSAPATPGTHQINTARVIVTSDRVLIAVDGPTGPSLVFSQSYVPGSLFKNPDKSKDSYLTAETGQAVVFRKDTVCGCGSRLRSWNPFRSVSSTKDPTE